MARDDDSPRVFDVSKPHKVSPSATSRPVIVGHHPQMADPMVKESHSGSDFESRPVTTVPVTSEDDEAKEPEEHKLASLATASSVSLDESHHVAPILDKAEEPDSEDIEKPPLHKPKEEKKQEKADPDLDPAYLEHPLFSGKKDSEAKDHGHKHKGHSHGNHDGNLVGSLPLPHPRGAGPRSLWRKMLLWLLSLALVVVVGGYLAIDSGLIESNIKLPFHLFNQKTTDTQPPSAVNPPPPASRSTLPAGFSNYQLPLTAISFGYPTVWGTPTVTPEAGFTKRGGANKSDGNYAYLISFATNRDIQVAVTSSKYLPPTRAALYYDFLQWCIGTNDGKFYKSLLHFGTAAKIDTPTTITCDQGPLDDATKLDNATLLQPNTKAADGVQLGDLYTKNLIGDYPVLRIKDATMANGDNIKKLLGTVKVSSFTGSTTSQ